MKYTKIRTRTKRNFMNKIKKMDLHQLTDKNINVLGSYWGMLKHCDCRRLWYICTEFKDFYKLKDGRFQ